MVLNLNRTTFGSDHIAFPPVSWHGGTTKKATKVHHQTQSLAVLRVHTLICILKSLLLSKFGIRREDDSDLLPDFILNVRNQQTFCVRYRRRLQPSSSDALTHLLGLIPCVPQLMQSTRLHSANTAAGKVQLSCNLQVDTLFVQHAGSHHLLWRLATERPQTHLNGVHTEIQHGATTETLHPQAIDVRQHEAKLNIHLANLAKLPSVDTLPHQTVVWEKPRPDGFHQEKLSFGRSLDQPLRLTLVEAEWFLTQHMLAMVQHQQHQLVVRVVDRPDVNDICERTDARLIALVRRPDAMVGCEFFSVLLLPGSHGHNLMIRRWQRTDGIREIVRDVARTSDSPA
uniref:Uncharacterized protein n=1 Tax=Anopheles farauti TaxID=69004 RepID=A0A182QEX2_9DIPT